MTTTLPPTGDPYRSMPPALGTPPRALPGSVRVRVLLGGTLTQMGAALLIFGSMLAWLTFDVEDTRSLFEDERTLVTVPARITKVQRSDAHRSHRPIYVVDWRALDGAARSGTSYTELLPSVGDVRDLALPPGHPERAHLRGMRSTRYSAGGAFLFFLVPLIGLVLYAVGLVRGRRALRLLRDGEVTRGRLVDKRPTPARINGSRVYALTFRFETAEGAEQIVVAKTHKPELLEDEPTEQLVYLASDPARATMIDCLPGAPRVRADGSIAPDRVLYASWAAFVALLAVAVSLALPWLALR